RSQQPFAHADARAAQPGRAHVGRLLMMNRVLAMAVVLAACKGGAADPPDSGQPANCAFIDASACQAPTPSYATDIVPILDRRCNSTCHAPGVGPWPLT